MRKINEILSDLELELMQVHNLQSRKKITSPSKEESTQPVIVQIEGVSKSFSLGREKVGALKEISFNIHKGDFLAIVGPSGSGKTTLLNLIGCIEIPSKGSIKINGVDIRHLPTKKLDKMRSHEMGFIFQNFNLLPVLTVEENVEYPLFERKIPKAERKKRVAAMLKEVGLERHAKHKPGELSGGQRQRVAIARALVGLPSLILADEPTANLDQTTGAEIIDLMKHLNKKLEVTFVFSTHDPKIMGAADQLVELIDGKFNFA